jgi:hypothetical protein
MTLLQEGCHFPRKNYSAEHGTDGNFDVFRRNSGCFAEQKTLGVSFRGRGREKSSIISFQTLHRKEKGRDSERQQHQERMLQAFVVQELP